MRAGMEGAEPVVGHTWQDVDLADAEASGMFVIRQDVSMLDDLADAGLEQFEELVDIGLVDVTHLDAILAGVADDLRRGVEAHWL